ncbi:hypothetical protein RJT34_19437 [Clitoria ternatea]|uniref:Uncharacterized protein n=1 Tax=Clitoria ternatea TaxID=43366 RepID=A0AAN9P3Q9_CLITE
MNCRNENFTALLAHNRFWRFSNSLNVYLACPIRIKRKSRAMRCGVEGSRMGVSLGGFRSSLPFSGLIRQLEQEMETVIKVLQPGPLGIIEHKFSAEEIRKANATVSKAVANWRTNATLDNQNHVLKDYIDK